MPNGVNYSAIKQKTRGYLRFLPKFVAVGLFGVLLGEILLWYLTGVVHLYYLVSSAITAGIAVLSDFTLNSKWTFAGGKLTPALIISRLAKYAGSKAVGFGIAFGVLLLLTRYGGINYLISNVFGVAASFVWNYTLSRYWVWRQPAEASSL
jgi:dolichol-phosphate mannosyltransferase